MGLEQILFLNNTALNIGRGTDEKDGMKVTGAELNVKPNKIKQNFSS